ncbi:MAG: universal stress protein [Actinomycetia bacterium]|nr:universal stress protein [Actinomycetes bacterium]
MNTTTLIIVTVEATWSVPFTDQRLGLTRIVVPLDGSELARAALVPAKELAQRSGARLELLTTKVAEGPPEPTSFLDDIADAIDGVELRTVIRVERDPVQAIDAVVNEDEPSALIVMSSHGRGRIRRSVLGSTAELVVASGSAPAVVVGPAFKPDTFNPDGPILIAHDGDHEPDLDIVTRMAKTTSGQILILAVSFSPSKSLASHRSAPEVPDPASACADQLREMGFEVTTEHRQGPQTHKVIVDEAERLRASYVAITSRARTGARRAALGSVAAGVVRSSPVPVLITRSHYDRTDEQSPPPATQ